jgi:hypothetical protein
MLTRQLLCMDFVRNPGWAAWGVLAGGISPVPGCLLSQSYGRAEGGTMSDFLYIGLTIVVFAALFLLVKGVERFER